MYVKVVNFTKYLQNVCMNMAASNKMHVVLSRDYIDKAISITSHASLRYRGTARLRYRADATRLYSNGPQ